MELTQKVALVTGGTKGIGAATALALAREGAEIALIGRHDDDDAQAVRQAVRSLGRRCEMIVADCARPEEARRSVQEKSVSITTPS